MRFAMAEGLEAATAARHIADVATTMHAHVTAHDRVPSAGALAAAGPDPGPHQAQREEAVLAGLLTQPPGHARQILDILEDGDFTDPHRRAVFHAIGGMHAAGMAVDPLTVDWELSGRDLPLTRLPEEDGPDSYTTRLARSAISDEQAIQAARDLAASHEQSRSSHPAGTRRDPASPRRTSTARSQRQASPGERPKIRLLRPPRNDGPSPGPQQGR
jgi:hypothetical protein